MSLVTAPSIPTPDVDDAPTPGTSPAPASAPAVSVDLRVETVSAAARPTVNFAFAKGQTLGLAVFQYSKLEAWRNPDPSTRRVYGDVKICPYNLLVVECLPEKGEYKLSDGAKEFFCRKDEVEKLMTATQPPNVEEVSREPSLAGSIGSFLLRNLVPFNTLTAPGTVRGAIYSWYCQNGAYRFKIGDRVSCKLPANCHYNNLGFGGAEVLRITDTGDYVLRAVFRDGTSVFSLPKLNVEKHFRREAFEG